MTKKPKGAPVQRETDQTILYDHPIPPHGGSFIQDPETGALTEVKPEQAKEG
jgi:hypothetical protein